MTAIAENLLPALVRTTLWLSLAVLVVEALLRLARPRSVDVHRAGWVLALLVGWLFVGPRIEIPWYEAGGTGTPASTKATPAVPEPAGPIASTDFDQAHEIGPSWAAPVTPSLAAIPASGAPASVTHDVELARVPSELPAAIPDAVEAPTWRQRAVAFLSGIDWRTNLPVAVVVAWIAGIVVMLGVTILSYLRLVRQVERQAQLNDRLQPEWQAQWLALLEAEGVRCSIPLRATNDAGPSLCRLPRGYVLLVPVETWSELSVAARAAILRHELMHYRRGDVWKSLAVRMLALPHWFNPAAWWSVRRFDEAAEWACDRAAVAELPATEFAAILVNLGAAPAHPASFNPAARGRSLAARVRRLLSGEPREDSTMKKLVVLISAALVIVVAALRFELVAEEPPAAPPIPASPPEAEQPQVKVETTLVEPPQAVANEPADDAAAELLAASRKGFEAANAAYHTGTATLDLVCQWSERWLAAQLEVDANPPRQVEYCRQHLARLQQLHAHVKALFDVAAQGGETEKLALTEYNVALAKRHLAQLEQRAAQWRRQASTSSNLQIERNMPEVVDPSMPADALPAANGTPAPVVPAGFPEGIDTMSARYDGKSFDEWVTVLQQELSPARRAAAIAALSAFSEYDEGLALAAAQQIMRAMRTNRQWYFDNMPLGEMFREAINAFNAIDREIALPVLMAALAGDEPTTRRFALNVFAFGLEAPPEALAKFIELAKDENPDIRREAVVAISRLDRTSPAIVAALGDESPVVSLAAMQVLAPIKPGAFGGSIPVGEISPSLANDGVIAALGKLASTEVDAPLKHQLRLQVIAALGRLGETAEAALPTLEALVRSNNAEIRDAAGEAISRIRQGPEAIRPWNTSPGADSLQPTLDAPERFQAPPIHNEPVDEDRFIEPPTKLLQPTEASPTEPQPPLDEPPSTLLPHPLNETPRAELRTERLMLVEAEDSAKAETIELKHDDNTSAGKRSIAGSGHVVRFAAPAGEWNLTSVRIFGSRYGYPQTPKYFKVWVCDADFKPIAEFAYPYAQFKRGEPQWVEFKTKPTVVSKEFYLCVGFDPQQTSGVYVHYDAEAGGSSAVGLPEGDKPEEFKQGDWLIRPTLTPVEPKDAAIRPEGSLSLRRETRSALTT